MKTKPTVVGYNWRNTLSDYAARSGILGGFSVTLITIIFSANTAAASLYGPIRWGDLSALLLGLASFLFISAMDLFLQAKDSDMWGLPVEYCKQLEKNAADWPGTWKANLDNCDGKEKYARFAYNGALSIMFVGLFFVMGPYNIWVALVLLLFGFILIFVSW